MKNSYRLPASNPDQQKAIDNLLAKPLNFANEDDFVECLICHQKTDPFLMFEGQTCFTCTVDNHFEKLKNVKP